MEDVVEILHTLLYNDLIMSSPVLSGNMKTFIQTGMDGPGTREIVIDAPFYDLARWRKDMTVIHTGQTIDGKTAYAEWVERYGGFHTHNRSEGWVGRTIREVVDAIANQIGAEAIYEIRL